MKRPLLVLDLDETLLHSSPVSLGRAPDLRVGVYHTYARPHLREFLLAAQALYELAVWTAATRDYARPIIQTLFPDQAQLAFFFSRERCTPRYDHERGEHFYLKDLKKVKRRGYDLERVVILDDNPQALARHRGNLLPVRPYKGELTDGELPLALRKLEHLLEFDNFRTVDKGRLLDDRFATPV